MRNRKEEGKIEKVRERAADRSSKSGSAFPLNGFLFYRFFFFIDDVIDLIGRRVSRVRRVRRRRRRCVRDNRRGGQVPWE